MHGGGALSTAVTAPARADPRRAAFKSTVVGSVLQGLAALLVHLVPAFLTGKLYPVLATLTGSFTGFLFARAARGASLGKHLCGGAMVSGISGLLGAALFSMLGHLPTELVPVASVTSLIAGAIGVPAGRFRRERPG